MTKRPSFWNRLTGWFTGENDPVAPWREGTIADDSIAAEEAYSIEVLNDDGTPIPFVVNVFLHCFHMDLRTATASMLRVHDNGSLVVGRLNRHHAEKLVQHIAQETKRRGYPFRCRVVAPRAR